MGSIFSRFFMVILAVSLTLVLTGCPPKPNTTEDITSGQERTGGDSSASDDLATENVGSDDTVSTSDVGDSGPSGSDSSHGASRDGSGAVGSAVDGLRTVYFDYKDYSIKSTEADVLESNAQWLKANPGVRLTIEGHADERGADEYNLALGEKRAKSVEKYLVDLGVDASRLSTVSYGEERPADSAHNEGAWGRNRRAEFVR